MAVTATTVAIMVAASAAISAAGAISSGIAARDQAKGQAEIDEQRAERERQVAGQQEGDFRKRQLAAAASIRAAGGGSGKEMGSGSPLLSAIDFTKETERQALRIREGGEIRGTRLEQQASLLRDAGKAKQTAGFVKAGSSLLSGGFRSASILA